MLVGVVVELVVGLVAPAVHSGWRLLFLLITVLAVAHFWIELLVDNSESSSARWLTVREDGDDKLPLWFITGLAFIVGLQIFWYVTCPENDPILPIRGLRLPSRITVVAGMIVLARRSVYSASSQSAQ